MDHRIYGVAWAILAAFSYGAVAMAFMFAVGVLAGLTLAMYGWLAAVAWASLAVVGVDQIRRRS